MKKFKLSALTGLVTAVLLMAIPGVAHADFNANKLIDDGVMNNSSSMSAAAIDSFLNTFGSSCISPNRGFTAPDPTGYSPSGGFTYGGNVTAGTIIYHAAQAYDINPQVLLTTLQKEQSLVSGGGGCSTYAYASAAGYGCPDGGTTYDYSGVNLYTLNGTTVTSINGTCVNSSLKVGFSQQLIRAAWLLKFGQQRSLGNSSWAIVRGSWDNSDDLNSCYGGPMTQGTWKVCPNGPSTFYDGYRSIDGQAVHIESGGTAALYWYTPHLHGNQNFVSIFSGWFGSPVIPNYSWQLMSQYAYTDQTKTVGASTHNMLPNTRIYVGLQVKNTSGITWSNSGLNPIDLGTINPIDRNSAFYDPSWIGLNRPARMIESSVAPGGTATFEFWMKAPNSPGNYREYFDLVSEGQAWFPTINFNFDMSVIPPVWSWQSAGQYAYTDQNKTTGVGTTGLMPGNRIYVGIRALNTGNMTWQKNGPNPVHLGTIRSTDRSSVFFDSTWLGQNRAASLVESSVAPGQVGTFEFWMTASNRPGTYDEFFAPVVEGIAWMNDPGVNFHTSIGNPNFSWQMVSQYAYTDQNKTTGMGTTDLNPGDRVYVGFTARNTGNTTWSNTGPNPVNVGMTHPVDRLSNYFDGSWLGQNRPARLKEASVAPGQIGTFEFWMKAPATTHGVSLEYFTLVSEGMAWFNDPQLNFYMSTK